MNAFDVAAILIAVAAVSGYLNHQFLRLPVTSGTLVVALLSSVIIVAVGLRPLATIFYPASMGSALLTVGPPAIEAAVMIGLLAVRWQAANRSIRPPATEQAVATS